MNEPKYPVEYTKDRLTFYFISESEKHKISKSIQYTSFAENQNIFNLAFGDLDENGELNDRVISNNNDMPKVLATVLHSVFLFFETYPSKIVFFMGSTTSRTRLYQILLNRIYGDINNKIMIEGIRQGLRESFVKNVNYDAFLIYLKKQ